LEYQGRAQLGAIQPGLQVIVFPQFIGLFVVIDGKKAGPWVLIDEQGFKLHGRKISQIVPGKTAGSLIQSHAYAAIGKIRRAERKNQDRKHK
jgi:hypothetical protein